MKISACRTQTLATQSIQRVLDQRFKTGTLLHFDLEVVGEYTDKGVRIMELKGTFTAEFQRYQKLEFGCKLRFRRLGSEEAWNLDQFESVSHEEFANGREMKFTTMDQSNFNTMLTVLGILK